MVIQVTKINYENCDSGTHDISADPLFVDAADSYYLKSCSPCVDAGTDTDSMPNTDHGGNPRPYAGGTPDMGAYEYQGTVLTATASSNSPVCVGNTIELTGGPGGMSSYSWTGPGSWVSTQQNPTRANAPTAMAGDYTLTVINASGYTDAVTTGVTVNNTPTATASSNSPVCAGNTIPLSGEPNGMSSYSWTGPGGWVSTQQNPTCANATTAMAGNYILTVTNSNGCTDSATTNVVVNAGPTANADADVSISPGSCTTLSGSASGGAGGYSYSWNPTTGLSNPNIANPTACPTATTTYTLTVTDANGCSDQDQVKVTVSSTLTANAGADDTICFGTCTTLQGPASGGSSPYTYAWSPTTGLSNANVANPTACPTATTIYTLTVTDNNGCTDDDQVTVTVNPSPVASAGADDTSICNHAIPSGLGGMNGYVPI